MWGLRKDLHTSTMRKLYYARFSARENHEMFHDFGAEKQYSIFGLGGAIEAVAWNKRSPPQEWFRVSQSVTIRPEYGNGQGWAERYLWSDLQFLSDNLDNEKFEISHARDTEKSLLLRTSPRSCRQLFKSRLSSIRLKSEESGGNLNNLKSVRNNLLIAEELSQTSHESLSAVDVEKPDPPNGHIYHNYRVKLVLSYW